MIFFGQFNNKYLQKKYITQNDIMLSGMDTGQKEAQPISVMGIRLRELRKAIGLSQIELSQAVRDMVGGNQKGTQSHISNLENPTSDKLPSVQVLRALAIILGTNTDYLLGLTDDDRPHGQLDDQVVMTVEDPQERTVIQEAMEALRRAPKEDKDYIVGLIRRLSPKPPRIIGDE